MGKQRDNVDRIVNEWHRSKPDVDISPIEIIGRVSRLSRIIDHRLAENFALHDIENWMYDMMATLRRIGEPYELSAGDLVKQTMVTTGAMTNRIDRLEQRGYVKRIQSATDRRSVTVRLTAKGIEKVDTVAHSHYQFEDQLLEGLSVNRRTSLEGLLRTLLVSLGDTDPDTGPEI